MDSSLYIVTLILNCVCIVHTYGYNEIIPKIKQVHKASIQVITMLMCIADKTDDEEEEEIMKDDGIGGVRACVCVSLYILGLAILQGCSQDFLQGSLDLEPCLSAE